MFNALLIKKSAQLKTLYLSLFAVAVTVTSTVIADVPKSKVENVSATAASQNKYTFIMFWKQKDSATSTMWKNLNTGLKTHAGEATLTQVQTNDPAEANIVKKYGVSRAPMPLTLAIAPNGAVTGSFVRRLDQGHIEKSFVSPTKSQCMHALQNRNLVLLNILPISKTGTPQGVDEFKQIPCYQKSAKVITLSIDDPEEASFVKELDIPTNSLTQNVVFMAPPGVLIGKYKEDVTKEQLIADLKKTGKGCGVEGCKHCK